MESGGRSGETLEPTTVPEVSELNDVDILGVLRARQAAEAEPHSARTDSQVNNLENNLDLPENSREFLRQRNIEKLLSYYGDTQFVYGSHRGTVIDMTNLCPPIQSALDREDGFEVIVGMVDGFKVKEAIKADENDKDDKKADEEPKSAPAKTDDKPPKKSLKTEAIKEKPVRESKTKARQPKPKLVTLEKKSVKSKIKSKESAGSRPVAKSEIHVEKAEESVQKAVEKVTEKPSVAEAVPTSSALKPEKALEKTPEKTLEKVEPKEEKPKKDEPPKSTFIKAEPRPELLRPVEIITIPHSEIFETWRELGEKQTPLETSLTTIIDELAIQLNAINESEAEPMPELAAPELGIVLSRVRTAKAAFEKLYAQATPEKHAEQIVVAIDELSKLLSLIGYERPNDIIRVFLENHPPQALYDLLEYLEAILSQSIERGKSTTAASTTSPHSMLGRLAMRVLEIFAPGLDTAAG